MRHRALLIVLGAATVLVALAIGLTVFPDVIINGSIKERNVRAFEAAHPGHELLIADLHYEFWHDRLTCDSVSLVISDSGFSGIISAITVDKVSWIDLLRGRVFSPEHLANSSLAAENARFTFERAGYGLRCSRLNYSAPDSLMELEDFELAPLLGDEEYFAVRPTRRPRYRLMIPRWSVTGASGSSVVEEKRVSGRVSRVEGLIFDVLVNKDKPKVGDPIIAHPPHQMLEAIRRRVDVDSLAIVDASFVYGERFRAGGTPALMTFDSIQLSVGGISGEVDESDSAVVTARAIFMGGGALSVRLAAPHSDNHYSFRYSGALTRMNLSRLNRFVEVAEGHRVKSGLLHKASFDIRVTDEHAVGSLWATYSDLNFAILDPETGREGGLRNLIAEFLANAFKIRNDNPGRSGEFVLGTIDYRRKPDQRLPTFLWFALRTGVNDLVGF